MSPWEEAAAAILNIKRLRVGWDHCFGSREKKNLTADWFSLFHQRSRWAQLDTGWSQSVDLLRGGEGGAVWLHTPPSLTLQQLDHLQPESQWHGNIQLQILQGWFGPHLLYIHLCPRWGSSGGLACLMMYRRVVTRFESLLNCWHYIQHFQDDLDWIDFFTNRVHKR